MEQNQYIIVKDQYGGQIVYIDYRRLNGFHIKPRNQVKYDGIVVNKMILVKPSFIEKLLKKKIKRKLDVYLQYIIALIDNDDASDPTSLRNALNDLTRYKSIIYNNYRRYLDEKYIALLLKKIALLEHELKTKLMYVSMQHPFYPEPTMSEEEKHRSR